MSLLQILLDGIRARSAPLPAPLIDTSQFNTTLTSGSVVSVPLTNVSAGVQYEVRFLNMDGSLVTSAGACGTGTPAFSVPPPPDYTGISVMVPSSPPTSYYLEVGLPAGSTLSQQRNRIVVTVQAAAGPSVGLSVTPASPAASPVTATYTATASGGTPPYMAFNWTLDGTPVAATVTIPPPPPGVSKYTHISDAPETYTVAVTVTDANGVQSAQQQIVYMAT